MAKLVDAPVIFYRSQQCKSRSYYKKLIWKPVPFGVEVRVLLCQLHVGSSSVVEQLYLLFAEKHMKFLLMTINQRVVGSNPTFPPKNTRLQNGYFLLYFI